MSNETVAQVISNEAKEQIIKYMEAYESVLKENIRLRTDCDLLIHALQSLPYFTRRMLLSDKSVRILIEGK